LLRFLRVLVLVCAVLLMRINMSRHLALFLIAGALGCGNVVAIPDARIDTPLIDAYVDGDDALVDSASAADASLQPDAQPAARVDARVDSCPLDDDNTMPIKDTVSCSEHSDANNCTLCTLVTPDVVVGIKGHCCRFYACRVYAHTPWPGC
jgi:hypothetical protein